MRERSFLPHTETRDRREYSPLFLPLRLDRVENYGELCPLYPTTTTTTRSQNKYNCVIQYKRKLWRGGGKQVRLTNQVKTKNFLSFFIQ
jgi:hypothetical protein